MPHGLGGIIAIGIGFWALAVNWWSFTEMLLGLVPLLFVVGGLVAVVAGIKMVLEKRRLAKEGDGPSKVPEKLSAKNNGASNDDYRKFKIVLKATETHDVTSFYLKPQDGKPLPTFLPGQYLTFKLNLPGQGKPVVRCYSLSEGNHSLEQYRVTIKRVPAPGNNGDIPPGLGSNFFHDHLNEGDVVEAKPPKGHFYLDMEQTSPIVLIAGGVGMTPLFSMLDSLVKTGSKRETWFLFGVRNQDEHIMKEQLEALAKQSENVHLKVFYSKPGKSDVKGQDYDYAERISVKRLKRLLPSNNNDYYICAPSLMIDEVRKDLEKWAVPKNKIHYESFGQATVKKATQPKPLPEQPSIQINFAQSNKSLAWKDSYDSILDLAEDNGIELESGCRTGSCGSCEVAYTSGSVIYLDEPDFEPDEGSCLTCISIPNEDLTLDA